MSVSSTYLSTPPCGYCGFRGTVWVMAQVITPRDEATPWVPIDTFGARLALLRQALGGWNVKRTADACELDDQKWRNWEAGKSKPRDLEGVARQIADATGCDYVWLMAGGPLRSRCFSIVPVENHQMELSFLPDPNLTSV